MRNSLMKVILTFLFMLFFPAGLVSQGGSNYSLFGVGDIHRNVGASYDALAGTSIAFPTTTNINLNNPAMWSFVNQTRLQVGYRFNQNLISNGNEDLMQNNGTVDGVVGLFMIEPKLGLGIGFGLYRYSSVNYFANSPISATIDDLTVQGEVNYKGKGGISAAYVGMSIEPIEGISFGLLAMRTFGLIETLTETEFYNSFTFNSSVVRSDSYGGLGLKGGLNFNIDEKVNIGAFFETHPSFSVSSDLIYQTEFNPDTTFNEELNPAFPTSFGLGASYITGKFILGMDFSMQDFSNFEYRRGSKADFRNYMLITAGVERTGNDDINASFTDKISYRFGAGYNQLYYSVLGNSIDEYFGSFGMLIPMRGSAQIDASVTIGMRGTTGNNLLLETFARFTVNLSIGETWFKPFRREWD